jgi:hypothetical protein
VSAIARADQGEGDRAPSGSSSSSPGSPACPRCSCRTARRQCRAAPIPAPTHLGEHLHRELRRDRAGRDQLVERVRQRHPEPARPSARVVRGGARARRAAVELVVGAVAGRHVCCCRGRAAAGEVKPGKRPRAGSTRRPAAFVIAAPTRATRALTSRLRLDLALYTQISDCSDPPIFMGALSLYPDIRARHCPDTARVSLSGSKPPSPSESICAFGAAWSSCLRLRQALVMREASLAMVRNGGRRRFHR